MRVLITGITGMVGSFLAEYLVDQHPDVEVFGTFRWRSKLDNLQELRNRGKLNVLDEGQRITEQASLRRFVRPGEVTVIDCELQDASAVRGVIRAVLPDRIFHLAAQSFVPTSWTAPACTLTNNIVSQVNMFEAVREAHLDPVIHIAGSSEEYGLVYPDEAPISERQPAAAAEPVRRQQGGPGDAGAAVLPQLRLKCVVTRGFNHTGPRRGQVFATSSFARQIAEIEAGLRKPVIDVGDLDSKRDWTDTRDMVRAYWLAAERGDAGRGLQRRPGDVHSGRRHARHSAEPLQRRDRQGTRPVAHAAERRAAAVGQRRQVQAGHRLGADDPVRPDDGRSARLLARARPRPRSARRSARASRADDDPVRDRRLARSHRRDVHLRQRPAGVASVRRVLPAVGHRPSAASSSGYDTRFGSDRFARAVAEVLTANGVRVLLSDRFQPTPVISYSVIDRQAGGAIIITASHNPSTDNGFKVKSDVGSSAPPEDDRARSSAQIDASRPRRRSVQRLDLAEAEARGLFEMFDATPRVRRADRPAGRPRQAARRGHARRRRFDVRHRAGRTSSGCCRAADAWSTRSAMSSTRRFLASRLSRSGRTSTSCAERCPSAARTLGLATDGDADRIGLVAEDGTFINQHQVFGLLVLYLTEQRGLRGPAVRSVTMTSMADAYMERLGQQVDRDAGRLQVHRRDDGGRERHSGRRGERRLRLPGPHSRARRDRRRAVRWST